MQFEADAYPNRGIFTVSALARAARLLIEENFNLIEVEGELSNFRRPGSGHWYFTMKDDNAQIRCAMFAGRNRRLSFQPRDGQMVRIRGRVSLYEARGDFQIIVDDLAEAGEGALRAAFEALQKKLAEQGLFDPARKRPLPELPRHLTIISSPSGAALRDVLHVVQRRFPALGVTLIPTLVQGEGAQPQLLAALDTAARLRTDVVLITRGGGSLEDLWPFNLESVALAVAACPHPVVSAIGHQTDFTITDFVADVRAPTPSAGAELVTPDGADLLAFVGTQAARLLRGFTHELRYRAQSVDLLRMRLIDPRQALRQQMQQADDLEARLTRALRHRLTTQQHRLRACAGALTLLQPARALPLHRRNLTHARQGLRAAIRDVLRRRSLALGGTAHTLQAVSPLNTLTRGYAALTRAPEQPGGVEVPITTISGVAAGDTLTAYLKDGALQVSVDGLDADARLMPELPAVKSD